VIIHNNREFFYYALFLELINSVFYCGFADPGFFCYVFVQINLMLCLFNLIPIYPLDGSHVLENLLPYPTNQRVGAWNRQYGGMLLLGLILLSYFTPISIFGSLIGPPITFFRRIILGF